MTPLFALSLARPEWLLVMLAVPLFVLLTLRAARGRPRAGDWAALVARTLLLALIALSLAAPRIERESKGRSTAYVLDLSESMPPDALAQAGEFVKRSASLRTDDDDVAFVVFADGAAVEVPFARVSATRRADTAVVDPTHVASQIGRAESDIEAGLRLARAGFPPGGARRIVVLTDGNETRGDAAAAVRELLADRVDVQFVPVTYEREREVLVEKLVAPSIAPADTAVPVRVVVSSTHDGVRARIRFLVDDVEVVAHDEVLQRGRNVYQMGHRFGGGGLHRIEALVEPELDGDPANNRGLAATQVRGRGRVLVATGDADSPLARTLSAELDADVDVTGPDGIPADAGGLLPYDGVVLENVPAFALSEVQRRVLAAGVRDLGLGLVCVGGTAAYGPGGYAATELEDVLPVSSEVSQKRVLPSGALVVILHTCEFPGGNTAARTITKAAISALSAQDEIGVVDWEFGGNANGDHWVIPLQRVGEKSRHMQAVEGANPSDMPSFDSSLRLAADAFAESTAAAKHIVIISDGDPTPPDEKLATRIRDARITISTVLVDPHSRGAQQVMRGLADLGGGRFHEVHSDDLSLLPQIFIKEAVTVRRSAWSEEPFLPALRGMHRALRDVSEGEIPQLLGYTVTTIKPQAELLLSGPEEDPVLARWRHGLGESVAWTSDATTRWSQHWVAWSRYPRFWGQLVRSTLRALQQPGARVSTDVTSGTATVALDVLEPDGSFRNGLQVAGTAVLPDGGAQSFRVVQTGQGRYEGKFPATQVGTYVATLTYRDADDPPDAKPEQIAAAVCVAYSAEHLAQRWNERFFAVLQNAGATRIDIDALPTGAEVVDPATLPWTGPSVTSAEGVDLWPWLAAAAALVLVADVAVRRVRVPWDRVIARVRGTAARLRPAAKGPMARGPAKPRTPGAYDASAAPPAGSTPSSTATPPAPGAPPSAPSSQPPATGGLLGAKRRAQKKQKWEET